MASAGASWGGGGGGGGGGAGAGAGGGAITGGPGVADGVQYWNSGSSRQAPFGEQLYQPLSPHPAGAAGYGGNLNTNAAAGARPPPSGSEPPSKKIRSVEQSEFGSDPGYGEAPPGSGYGGSGSSAPVVTQAVSGAQSYAGPFGQGYGVSNVQSYTDSGAQGYAAFAGQSYGATGPQGYGPSDAQTYATGYGSQQTPSYGAGSATPTFASQHVPQQSAPVFQQSPQQSGYGGAVGVGRGKGLSNLFYKTKLCTKFKTGTCTFNENCSFAHGVEELRKPQPGWEQMVNAMGGATSVGRVAGANPTIGQSGQRLIKTRLCRFYVEGNCPYGDRCNFLHGNQEEQTIPGMNNVVAGPKPSSKTRLCARWEKGEQCDFGEKCQFAHGYAELQSYSTGVAPHDGGALTDVTQQLSSKPESAHTEQSRGNSLPAQVTYTTEPPSGGASSATNLNAYQNPGTVTQSYLNSQANTNGASTNYGYWDQEKKWEGAGNGATQAAVYPQVYTQSNQGYAQPNQVGSWTAEYSGDRTYSRSDTDTGASQYPIQQPQQQQNVPFFRGGSAREYVVQKQDLSSPYGQGDVQNEYQGTSRNGDASYAQGGYTDLSYSAQQADYSSRY